MMKTKLGICWEENKHTESSDASASEEWWTEHFYCFDEAEALL